MLLFKSGFNLTHILAMNECICVLVSEAFTTDAQILYTQVRMTINLN